MLANYLFLMEFLPMDASVNFILLFLILDERVSLISILLISNKNLPLFTKRLLSRNGMKLIVDIFYSMKSEALAMGGREAIDLEHNGKNKKIILDL